MRDIESRADIELLMRSFYSRLLSLPEMKPVFEGLDFEAHLPRIVAFWAFVLLEEEGYRTSVFDKHLHLPLNTALFDTWLRVFSESVDSLFSGEKAELAKHRAAVLTHTFKSKWEHLKR